MHTAFIHSKTHNPLTLSNFTQINETHHELCAYGHLGLSRNITDSKHLDYNAWLTTLQKGVHGRTNFTDKIHQIQIQIFQCGILQLLFASNIKTQVFLKVCCPQGFSRMIAE